jgi:hypothetical protein
MSTSSLPGSGYVTKVIADTQSVLGAVGTSLPNIYAAVAHLIEDATSPLNPLDPLLSFSVPGASGSGVPSFITPSTLAHGSILSPESSTASVHGASLPFSDNTVVTLNDIFKH